MHLADGGDIRVYTAQHLINISDWKRIYKIKVDILSINSISWNKNLVEPPIITIAEKIFDSSFMNKKDPSAGPLPQSTVNNFMPINEDIIYENLRAELKSFERKKNQNRCK